MATSAIWYVLNKKNPFLLLHVIDLLLSIYTILSGTNLPSLRPPEKAIYPQSSGFVL
jgi:hypothetical protein